MMRRGSLLLLVGCLAVGSFASASPNDSAIDDLATRALGRTAFAQPFAFIEGEAGAKFRVGSDLFRLPWSAQSEAQGGRFGGLGPLSNRFSCAGCHIGNGRGKTTADDAQVMRSTLVRLSIPGTGPNGAPLPEPTYGEQLQPTGMNGVMGEGEASLRWHEFTQTWPGGSSVSLRKPEIVFSRLHYGPMAPATMTSVRMSPPLFGLGLLAAVPDMELIALADPDDANHDGIRGRLNHVWNVESGRKDIGRFGLKANQPSLRQQVAAALIGDMGITSRLFMQQNCTEAEETCLHAASGRQPEIDDSDLATLVSYMAAIAPPAPRNGDRISQRGQALFHDIGCSACHMPNLTTGRDAAFPQLSNRAIHPYTDLLLHDMGEGLSDGRPDFEAGARDWRTAPLWGIGLAGAVIDRPTYLHDGRARSLLEAILWHGGEAAASRDSFAGLNEADRKAIIAFLNIL